MENILVKLKNLKEEVTKWIKNKKLKEGEEFSFIEDQIKRIHFKNMDFSVSKEDLFLTKELGKKKYMILKLKEKDYRLKSRALWIRLGDNNTGLFHFFSSLRRNSNSI